MVDCFDRIAVRMTELALEPVKLLRTRSLLAAVTLRTLSTGRRVNLTITKTWPDGSDKAPSYSWDAREVADDGTAAPDGYARTAPRTYADPEDAYWAAVDAVGTAVERSP